MMYVSRESPSVEAEHGCQVAARHSWKDSMMRSGRKDGWGSATRLACVEGTAGTGMKPIPDRCI